MPRKSISGYWGETSRITLRVSPGDLRALDSLGAAVGTDRSETLRTLLREAGAALRKREQEAADAVRQRERDAALAGLPGMSRSELLVLAEKHAMKGRSKMTVPELRDALHRLLDR